jgi:hypothetical protein
MLLLHDFILSRAGVTARRTGGDGPAVEEKERSRRERVRSWTECGREKSAVEESERSRSESGRGERAVKERERWRKELHFDVECLNVFRSSQLEPRSVPFVPFFYGRLQGRRYETRQVHAE